MGPAGATKGFSWTITMPCWQCWTARQPWLALGELIDSVSIVLLDPARGPIGIGGVRTGEEASRDVREALELYLEPEPAPVPGDRSSRQTPAGSAWRPHCFEWNWACGKLR